MIRRPPSSTLFPSPTLFRSYLVTVLSWLRLRPADAVYATIVTVLVTFLPFWLSIPRYLLGMYPLFLLAGRITRRWLYLPRSEEHTSELQSQSNLVCRLLLEK